MLLCMGFGLGTSGVRKEPRRCFSPLFRGAEICCIFRCSSRTQEVASSNPIQRNRKFLLSVRIHIEASVKAKWWVGGGGRNAWVDKLETTRIERRRIHLLNFVKVVKGIRWLKQADHLVIFPSQSPKITFFTKVIFFRIFKASWNFKYEFSNPKIPYSKITCWNIFLNMINLLYYKAQKHIYILLKFLLIIVTGLFFHSPFFETNLEWSVWKFWKQLFFLKGKF
mgnify:CR=1 FL=1